VISARENDVNARARSRLGGVLRGKYRLDRLLGVGGMAAVFAATHLRNANRVAVKILHGELAADEGLRARFLREGYAANSVGHAGTVRILDDDIAEDGAVYLVMELLEGETLEARWERKGHRLDGNEVASVLYHLLDVVAAAHDKGIVHRDIKPENLFLTREQTLKVLDFGVARLLESSVKTTRPGGILGTPAFMAPEQVLAKTREIDAQSDLWAVGATAFTLLSGHFVHDAETPEEMMVLAASRPARSLATVAPDLPSPLVSVVDRALMLDKKERWRDARAMQAAVANAYRRASAERMAGAEPLDEEEAEDKTVIMPAADLPDAATEPLPQTSSATATLPTGPLPVTAHRIQMLQSDAPPAPSLPAAPAPASPITTALPGRGSTIDGVAGMSAEDVARLATTEVRVSARRRPFALAAVGALATLMVGGFIALTAASSHQTPATGARSAPSLPRTPSSALASTMPAVSAAPVAQPIGGPASVAVEELPTRPPTNGAAKRTAAKPSGSALPSPSGSAVPLPATSSPVKADCAPPFTVDELTGRKKWKIECL
jgi:serine/threonine protein kinase